MTPKKKKILTFSIGGSILFLAAGVGAYFITDVRVEQKSPLTEEQKEFNKLIYNMGNMKSVDGTGVVFIGNNSITATPKVSIKDHKLEMNLSAEVKYDENKTIPINYDIYQEKHYITVSDTKLKYTVEEVNNILQYFKDAGIDLSFLEKIAEKLKDFNMTDFMDGLSLKKEKSEFTFSSEKYKGINICCDDKYNLSKIGVLNFVTNGVVLNGYFECDTNHEKEVVITCPETEQNPYTPITDYNEGIKRVTDMLGKAKGNELITSVKNLLTLSKVKIDGSLYFEGFGEERFKLMDIIVNVNSNSINGSLSNIPVINPIIEGEDDLDGIRNFTFMFAEDKVNLDRTTTYSDEKYNEHENIEITMEEFLSDPLHYILGFGVKLNANIITILKNMEYQGSLKSFLEKELKNLTFDEENEEWTISLDTASMMGSSLLKDTNIFLANKDKNYISNIRGNGGMSVPLLFTTFETVIDFNLTITNVK